MFELANGYSKIGGGGVAPESNNEKADQWYRAAAKLGHTGAMYRLSQGGGASNEERVMWLKKGAELGDGACMVELSKGYQHQLFGLPYDPVESFRWTRRSWISDFENRKYDSAKREKELARLLMVHREILQRELQGKGWSQKDIDRVMSEIE